MSAGFFDALMSHIMEGTMIPKVQIERAVGPILGMFLGEALTATLEGDPELSGHITMVCPEFPFKKGDNRQSENVDWLLLNEERQQLIFLELKTADTSIDKDQIMLYREKQKAVAEQGGGFLIDDVKKVRDGSGEFGKYDYLLSMILRHHAAIEACQEAKIIYLVPECAVHKVGERADRVLCFSMLADSIQGEYGQEWQTIRSELCKLDAYSKQSRNQKSKKTAMAGSAKGTSGLQVTPRWQGTMRFPQMVELCVEHGDDVLIGFTGGRQKFLASTLRELRERKTPYKWDHSKNLKGKKLSDWLYGAEVVEMLETHHGLSCSPQPPETASTAGTA